MEIKSIDGNMLMFMGFFSLYALTMSVKYFDFMVKNTSTKMMDVSTQTEEDDLIGETDKFSIIEENPDKYRMLFSKLK